MVEFVIKRLLAAVALLLVVSLLAYVMLAVGSNNVAAQILGSGATPEQIVALSAELGVDRPILVRYGDWLVHALTGDFGSSWFTREEVSRSLAARVPVTLSIVILSTLVTAVVSFGVGIAAAVRRGGLDRALQMLSTAGTAVPNFVVALVLATVFAVQLSWFPATGYVPPTQSISGWLFALTLPVIALSIQTVAATAQQVRSSVITTLHQDYVRTLRSRGTSEASVIFRHVLRNASVAPLTVLSLQFVALLSGAVVVEGIFALPGLGQLAVEFTARGDVPVVMGLVVYSVAIVVVVNLVVDLVIGWLNPKARLA